jgi:hypothetical protein
VDGRVFPLDFRTRTFVAGTGIERDDDTKVRLDWSIWDASEPDKKLKTGKAGSSRGRYSS